MAKTSHIYHELLKLLGQSKTWADVRHLHTLDLLRESGSKSKFKVDERSNQVEA